MSKKDAGIFDLEEFDIEDIRDVVKLCRRPDFAEGVAERLARLGVHCPPQDTETLLAEIKKRYRNRIGENCPRTIQEWVRGTVPGVTNRVNNYNLCYALEMDLRETGKEADGRFYVKNIGSAVGKEYKVSWVSEKNDTDTVK